MSYIGWQTTRQLEFILYQNGTCVVQGKCIAIQIQHVTSCYSFEATGSAPFCDKHRTSLLQKKMTLSSLLVTHPFIL